MKIDTEVPGIQDVQGPKRVAPPPTDQTPGPKWTRFWREPTHGIQIRGSEAIFEFPSMSPDTGGGSTNFLQFYDPHVQWILLPPPPISRLMG